MFAKCPSMCSTCRLWRSATISNSCRSSVLAWPTGQPALSSGSGTYSKNSTRLDTAPASSSKRIRTAFGAAELGDDSVDVVVLGRDRWTAGQHTPVVQQGEGLGLAAKDSLSDDDVRGQLAPCAEARAREAVHAVLAVDRQVEQVRRAVRMGQLSVGDRYSLANSGMPSTSSTEVPPPTPTALVGVALKDRRQLIVLAGCQRGCHEFVTGASGGKRSLHPLPPPPTFDNPTRGGP